MSSGRARPIDKKEENLYEIQKLSENLYEHLININLFLKVQDEYWITKVEEEWKENLQAKRDWETSTSAIDYGKDDHAVFSQNIDASHWLEVISGDQGVSGAQEYDIASTANALLCLDLTEPNVAKATCEESK